MRSIIVPVLFVFGIAMAASAQPLQTASRKTLPPPPPNDLFSNAEVQTGYHWYAAGVTYGATRQKKEPGKVVWYCWTAPASGPALVDLYNNDPGPSGTFNVFTGTNISSLKSVKPLIKRKKLALLFDAAMGTTYYMSVQKSEPKYSGNIADFTLETLLTTVALTQPTNGSTYKSSDIIPLSMITTEDPSMVANVKYLIYSSPWSGGGSPIVEADSFPYTTAWTNAIPGNFYVGAELTRTDGYVLDTARTGISIRPYNDDFVDRRILVGTNISLTEGVANATLEPGEPADNTGGSIWYSWTAPGDGYVYVPYVYGNMMEGINVFTGTALSNLIRIPITDHAGNEVPFPVSAGQHLQIAIFSGDLALTFYPLPANDSFASAIELSGTNTTIVGNNLAATYEPGEPIPDGATGHSVWYTWTAPTNGMLGLNVSSGPVLFTDQYNALVVTTFTGDELTNLTAVSTNVLGPSYVVPPPGPSYIPVVGGTTYHLAVDCGHTNAGLSTFAIDLSFIPAQANDGFADRAMLTGDNAYFTYSGLGASVEPGEPDHGYDSLWWTWTAPHDGTVLVSGIMYSAALGRTYTGDSLTNLTLVGINNPYFIWNAQAGTTYQIAITSGSPGAIANAGLHLYYYTNGTPIEP